MLDTAVNGASAPTDEIPTAKDRILCHIDNVMTHSIQAHLQKNHPDWTVERYQTAYPDQPILSQYAIYTLGERAKERAATAVAEKAGAAATPGGAYLTAEFSTLHEVFGLGSVPAAMGVSGNPVRISVMTGHSELALDYVPDVDTDYVYNIDLLKKVIIGFQLNILTATNSDAIKIVQQIMPHFDPEWTVRAQILEAFPDRSIDVPTVTTTSATKARAWSSR